MGFLRQEYWSRLPLPSPGGFQGIQIQATCGTGRPKYVRHFANVWLAIEESLQTQQSQTTQISDRSRRHPLAQVRPNSFISLSNLLNSNLFLSTPYVLRNSFALSQVNKVGDCATHQLSLPETGRVPQGGERVDKTRLSANDF